MNSTHLVRLLSLTLAILAFELTHCDVVRADVSVPNIFGSHMVLQQGQANPVWGWAEPDEEVTVTIGDQSHSAKADKDGR